MFLRRIAILFLLLLIALPATADWWPLEYGWNWIYYSDEYEATLELDVMETPVMVRGVATTELRYRRTNFQGSTEYSRLITETPEGDVYLHGRQDKTGLKVSYDPPVLILDVPLEMDKIWSTRYAVYEGLTVGGSLMERKIETYTVTEERFYTNWTGPTLYCLGLTQEISTQTATGTAEPGTTRDANLFYNDGVGPVIVNTFMMTGYNWQVAAEQMTWSALKIRFRD